MTVGKFPWCLLLAGLLSSCGSDDDSSSDDPALKGSWQGECQRFLADEYLAEPEVCGNPGEAGITSSEATSRQACIDAFELYYYRDTAVFADADSDADEKYPRLTYTRTTYYNADAEEAAACAADDHQAQLLMVWEYQTNPAVLLDEHKVDPANNFPDKAKGINAQLVSASMTHFDADHINTLNQFEACESSDWEAETAVDITDKDNCLFHALNLSEPAQFKYYSTDWLDDGEFRSSFIAGTDYYSIFKIDTDKDPREVGLGDIVGFVEEGFPFDATHAQAKEQVQKDGSSEARRETSFTAVLSFEE